MLPVLQVVGECEDRVSQPFFFNTEALYRLLYKWFVTIISTFLAISTDQVTDRRKSAALTASEFIFEVALIKENN